MSLEDDVAEFRAASRDMWEEGAAGWSARRAAFQAATAPVSAWMVDAIEAQPGQTVLELAAGAGDTGLLAAELLRPGGKLISTDGAEAMVAVARERAGELGLMDMVEARPMEAEWIDLETATVDAVLCRWGYMLLADPETALRETRRVLRMDGRVALAVWDVREVNPWLETPSAIGVELGFMEPTPPGRPGPFSLADREELEDVIATAGFQDIVIDSVDISFAFPSLDEVWETQLDMSPTLSGLTKKLTPADHYRLRDAFDARLGEYVGADGSVAVPGRTLVAVASA
ncbi:2-methoxy-6-polyprenyl-1,4-benzoquinol methylase, mitochondrial [Paraconexibacter sp. AEG42_29]|uniref:2-methoxy-6-polyprenyl-1,4-benzoquinol methylase, mitochondrial n=1 Tax=Paraconexibacter sp. AEG42_29 TaxID=2997339 RepID=A0AAU7AVY9_9ACTN